MTIIEQPLQNLLLQGMNNAMEQSPLARIKALRVVMLPPVSGGRSWAFRLESVNEAGDCLLTVAAGPVVLSDQDGNPVKATATINGFDQAISVVNIGAI